MGPCPRDARHPPRACREPGSKLRAGGTSTYPHRTSSPTQPLLRSQAADAKAKRSEGLPQRSAVQVLPQQSQ